MRISFRLIGLLLMLTAISHPSLANAALAAHAQRGEKLVEIPVSGRKAEVCVIPKHYAAAAYTDKDSKHEGDLCALDENTNAAVCPKLNSTNPGLDFFSLPAGSTPAQVQNARCKTAGAKMVAKYKLSTSCSYTPSILGYYHVSRMLGGVARVPPAVIRTFNLQNHIAIGRVALSETASSSLIHQTWASLMAQLTAGAAASRRDQLLTDDFSQSYGALSVNPTKESFYKEFFSGGSGNVGRAISFRNNNPIVALLARNADIGTLVGRSFTIDNVQKMVQLRDAADLIVMDTLMNQQDRFGNIHYVEVDYYRDTKDLSPDGTPKLKSSTKLTDQEVTQLGAVKVKEMLLKDNDCGVAKQNVAKQAGLADRIGHIDPDTYRRLLQLDKAADAPETRQFFTEEMLFTGTDYVSFRGNLKDLAAKLHQGCSQGHVKLDLDLQQHFSDRPVKVPSCDL